MFLNNFSKIIVIFSVIFFTNSIYSVDLPIMIQIKNKKIPSDFLDGVQESLTSMNYSIVDEKTQELALKEQARQRNSDCYDDECIIDTGKMLAAKAIILIETGNSNYYPIKFSARYVDLEKGTTTKTTTMYYRSNLNNNQSLFRFGKDIIEKLFNKRSYYARLSPKKKEESRWNFSLAGNFGVTPKSIEVGENTYGGLGIALSANIDLSYSVVKMKDEMTLNLYTELSYWSIGGAYNYNDGENTDLLMSAALLNLNIGFEFIFGKKVMQLPLFIRMGIVNGYMNYKGTDDSISKQSFKTFGMSFEFGIDQKLFANLFDFYIGTIMNLYMYEMNDSTLKVSGGDYPIYMGIRHTF